MSSFLQPMADGRWFRAELSRDEPMLLRASDSRTGDSLIEVLPLGEAEAASALADSESLGLVVPQRRQGSTKYVLLAVGRAPRRNGQAGDAARLAVLREGESLSWSLPIGTRRAFFDAFEAPRVETHLGAPAECQVCDGQIEVGEAKVRCPTCGTELHQTDDRPCWVTAGSCPSCGGAVDLDAKSTWVPKGLGVSYVPPSTADGPRQVEANADGTQGD